MTTVEIKVALDEKRSVTLVFDEASLLQHQVVIQQALSQLRDRELLEVV